MAVNKNCHFCGSIIEPGTGFLFVRRDGALLNFCSRKCERNMIELGRVPRKTRWTNEYHNLKSMKKQTSKN
ncbi:MAG: 50S ribosomal protein L24e [Thermoplasmataceae archaeon]|nr:50S ribosomal protein L24e [Candidatus Thermoplasmatota archaeon]